MKTRITPIAITVLSAVVVAGCGPSKAGIQARQDARGRLAAFSAQFTYDQARQEFESGQFDRALVAIDDAMQRGPTIGEFDVLKGRIFLETQRLERAMQSFLSALEKDPELAEAHYCTGIVFQRWSDDEEAFSHYLSAYELEPDNAHYLVASAESLIALGEFGEARKLVESKLVYFENDPALRHLLGQIAQLEGDPVRAASLYEDARLLDPDNIMLTEELAWAQYEAGQFAQCEETLALLQARLSDTRIDLKHMQARCLVLSGRSNDAHAMFSELSRLSPTNPSIWIEFGTLAWELKDFRRMAQCGARTVALSPQRFEGYLLKGLYEREEGRLDRAVELLQLAVEHAGDNVMPHLMLGQTLEERGDDASALATYELAIRVDPENEDALRLHAQLTNRMKVVAAEME